MADAPHENYFYVVGVQAMLVILTDSRDSHLYLKPRTKEVRQKLKGKHNATNNRTTQELLC